MRDSSATIWLLFLWSCAFRSRSRSSQWCSLFTCPSRSLHRSWQHETEHLVCPPAPSALYIIYRNDTSREHYKLCKKIVFWYVEITLHRVDTFTSDYVCAIAIVVPRLTVAAVATHPHRRISKRWHVADVKDFTGDDQATLTVDRNSAI